ncbi:phosphoenolpyruvate--protein phosphotransferase [Limisalsivibrio acetivorans]|uniref:phosphoenolpyruvate--protein phosphotransferase n=1 Tax=Limisalsivibrio acetivorans TaxID=1304888 RepID=UPI0003B57C46|nr:phosphoenolpyruvate--protein phosphotransferase [Limisalsivibrio acetivorans]
MRKIELLLGISNIILDSDDVEDTLKRTVAHLRRGLDSDVCSIYLLNRFKKNSLVLTATEGLSETAVGNVIMDTDKGLTGLTFTEDRYTFIRNASEHPRYNYFPGINEEPFKTFIGIPLKGRAHKLGVLVFQFQKNKRNTDIMKTLITAVAAQLSTVIMRHYLFRSIDEMEEHYIGEVRLKGIPLSGGIVVGTPVMVINRFLEANTQNIDIDKEVEDLHRAFEDTKRDLENLIDDIESSSQPIDPGIFHTHLMMLEDSMFRNDIEKHVVEHRKSAAFSVRHVADKLIKKFMSFPDLYLRERAGDIDDISKRLLAHLGVMRREVSLQENSILMADMLTPGETASLDLGKVTGFVTSKDGFTSHTAILAKSRHIPAVSGISKISDLMEVAESIIVDGDSGEIIINPMEDTLKEYEDLMVKSAEFKKIEDFTEPEVFLKNGERVEFYANISSVLDAEKAEALKADGIGLVRTEIFYLQSPSNFTAEKQKEIYKEILRTYGGQEVIFRLLDIGSDKKSEMEIHEDNPALGHRGVRLLLDDREQLRTQIKVLLELYNEYPNIKIMVPFVSSVVEFRLVRNTAEDIAKELGIDVPPMGVMVEIPSIIYYIEAISEYCDFFSVGSNDLFQYFFAADRTNPKVSSLYHPNNEAFLGLLQTVLEKVRSSGKQLEICGEIAADEKILTKLLRMGYRRFSVNPYVINDLRTFVKQLDI